MRTTIDLPEDLFRRAKARAALEGRKLKELIAVFVERGLQDDAGLSDAGRASPRSTLPVARPATGRTLSILSNAELKQILDAQDAAPFALEGVSDGSTGP